jgi:hypothetical protein
VISPMEPLLLIRMEQMGQLQRQLRALVGDVAVMMIATPLHEGNDALHQRVSTEAGIRRAILPGERSNAKDDHSRDVSRQEPVQNEQPENIQTGRRATDHLARIHKQENRGMPQNDPSLI